MFLTAIAWALKEWKLLALVAAVLGLLTVGYKLRAAYDAYEQVETLKRRLGAVQIITKHHEAVAVKDAERIRELEGKISATPPNTSACLDRAAAGRVRAIR